MNTKFKLYFSFIWTQCHVILYYCKNLGFHFIDDMRIDTHVQVICHKVYIDIRCSGSVRNLLSIDATKTLLSAVVLPKLDYCNSLFYGSQCICLKDFRRLKAQQQDLFFNVTQNNISPLLMSMHWLPINARIEFKLSVICHSFFFGLSPISLSDLLCLHTQRKFMLFIWQLNSTYP